MQAPSYVFQNYQSLMSNTHTYPIIITSPIKIIISYHNIHILSPKIIIKTWIHLTKMSTHKITIIKNTTLTHPTKNFINTKTHNNNWPHLLTPLFYQIIHITTKTTHYKISPKVSHHHITYLARQCIHFHPSEWFETSNPIFSTTHHLQHPHMTKEELHARGYMSLSFQHDSTHATFFTLFWNA